MAKTAAEMVAEAKARIENLTVEQAASEIERGDALVVDVREPEERANGSIPGAVAAPRGMLESGSIPPARITATSSIPGNGSSSTVPRAEDLRLRPQ